MTREIPGPDGSWLLGNVADFRAGMLPFFERCRREYGTVVALRLGHRRLILLSDPSLIEEVLVTKNKNFKKHFATRLLKPVLGNGLLLSEGKLWLRQRRLVQPAFSRQFTDEFVQIVQLHTSRLAEAWRGNPRRELYRDMTQLTVQIAAHAFLGISDAKDTEEIGDCLEITHADFERRFQHPWSLPTWIPTPPNRRLRKAVTSLTRIIDRMIDERRKDAEGRHDALSLLLRAQDEQGERMPIQLLRDEVMTLLLAGHDTTANGLTWTWSLLAQHNDVMSRLRNELRDSNLQPHPRDDNSFARKIVKESMRLFPPVFVFGREATCSMMLGDHAIRKGDSILMPQWVVHRDESFYTDPLAFDPDRWTPEFERALPKYAYFPFGGGPRVCIGREVAMVEATGVLAALASEFDVSLEDPGGVTPWPTVTLRPKDEVWARVTTGRESVPSKGLDQPLGSDTEEDG
jgi:cytochrome P450